MWKPLHKCSELNFVLANIENVDVVLFVLYSAPLQNGKGTNED